MCTIILLYRIFEDFPILIAHNRDELKTRKQGKPPQNLGGIIAPQDTAANGTWIGFNSHGLVNSLTNVEQTEINPNARSRGLLVLEGLRKDNCASLELYTLSELKSNAFNYFNLLYADQNSAHILNFKGTGYEIMTIKPGLHVLPSSQLENGNNPERRRNRISELYSKDEPRSIEQAWFRVMQICGDHYNTPEGSAESVCTHSDLRSTVSSTIILVNRNIQDSRVFHAQGPPCTSKYCDYSHLSSSLLNQ